MGTFLAVANGYVVVLYFLGARMFPETETLPVTKILVGILFFLVVTAFLAHDGRKGGGFLRYAWMPIVTLVSWTTYFGTANFLIKTGTVSPMWNVFVTEGSIFLVASAVLAFRALASPGTFHFPKIRFSDPVFRSGFFMAGFLAAASSFLFLSYARIPANVANTVSLLTNVAIPTVFWVTLGERPKRSEMALIAASVLLLAAFLIVP
jgi:hypothetical protein